MALRAYCSRTMRYRLLTEFESLFRGKAYLHRNSTQGDFVAMHLFEDLVGLGKSRKLAERVDSDSDVLNAQNKRRGIEARRGDGTFGELVPGQSAVRDPGYRVARGPVANVEIGIEVKILHKAQIKQIDRVIGDLRKQVDHFRRGTGDPICIGIVGINHAPFTVGYEGDRAYRTDGKSNRHPISEAAQAISRLKAAAVPAYTEFLFLRYIATNEPPFEFSWVDYQGAEADYAAILTRVSREYDHRF